MAYIWLSERAYPEYAKNIININCAENGGKYAIAEFTKEFVFKETPEIIYLTVCGDARYFLYTNGEFKGTGPAAAGGDFLTEEALPWAYSDEYEYLPENEKVVIFARVSLMPTVLTEFTQGHGMFMLEGRAVFADSTEERFTTDETWLCRYNGAYVSQNEYDGRIAPDGWTNAEKVDYPVTPERSGLEPLEYKSVYPEGKDLFMLQTGDEIEPEFDRVYAAYPVFEASGACEIDAVYIETGSLEVGHEHIVFADKGRYMSMRMYSVGAMLIKVISADSDIELKPYIMSSGYPVHYEGICLTDDQKMNRLIDVCRHTLCICRQSLHLDSPKHQELLACTGDYYIEMLMTLFMFGDLHLAGKDIERTARWLEQSGGRMFHTTYSLIWVQMLARYRLYTGDDALVRKCFGALKTLIERFASYMSPCSLPEDAPDFMFVDWTVVDGYSMHHPPKALGLTVLSAFLYKALIDAAGLSDVMGDEIFADTCRIRASELRTAMNEQLWDEDRRLYRDGLPTVTANTGKWNPHNPEKDYYTRYPQILCSLYDICPPEEKTHLAAISADDDSDMPRLQPYFTHFLLEALVSARVPKTDIVRILRKWLPGIEECGKGLAEGWIKPEEGYSFDHSHAWGGTPAYHLPLILAGLEVLEPGFARISLSPDLCGFKNAHVSFMTPRGEISICMAEGAEPVINVPEGIEYTVKS